MDYLGGLTRYGIHTSAFKVLIVNAIDFDNLTRVMPICLFVLKLETSFQAFFVICLSQYFNYFHYGLKTKKTSNVENF